RAGRPRRTRVRCPKAPDFLTLLQVGFAEPARSPGSLVVSCTTVSPLPLRPEDRGGGLLSVALSRGSPRVGVAHHLALWSPDFPRHRAPAEAGGVVTRSPGQPIRTPKGRGSTGHASCRRRRLPELMPNRLFFFVVIGAIILVL